jgi:predicted histidine transporter YuiF (NhaC family)
MKYFIWPNIMIGVFGGIIISNLLRLSDFSIYARYEGSLFLWLSIIILLIGLFLLVFKYYIRKVRITSFKMDERENAISDRSARNGLLATYFTLFILLALDIYPNARSLLIVIAAGLFVWIISSIFYYYKKA